MLDGNDTKYVDMYTRIADTRLDEWLKKKLHTYLHPLRARLHADTRGEATGIRERDENSKFIPAVYVAYRSERKQLVFGGVTRAAKIEDEHVTLEIR